MSRKRIYLAGPDVFYEDAIARGKALVRLCAEFGLEGLYPLDNAAPAGLEGRALARWIREANLGMTRRCDLVMADLNFFRGGCVDDGTAYECGYAEALEKPVYGHLLGDGDLWLRMRVEAPEWIGNSYKDRLGRVIEDFGLPINLMFDHARIVVGSARDCLERIATDLRQGRV